MSLLISLQRGAQSGTTRSARLSLVGSLVDATNLDGARAVDVVDGYAYVCAYDSTRFTICDVTGDDPVLVGSLVDATRFSQIRWVDVVDNIAAVLSSAWVSLVDVSDKSNPVILGYVNPGAFGGGHRIRFDGRYVYATFGTDDALAIIDAADPTTPVMVGSLVDATNLNDPFGIEVVGDVAFVACSGGGYTAVDISDRTAPAVISALSDPLLAGPHGIVVRGKYGYTVSSTADSVVVLDVSDPAAMTIVGSVETDGDVPSLLNGAHTCALAGDILVVCCQSASGFALVDVSDPTAPTIIDTEFDAVVMDGVRNLAIVGDKIYGASFTANSLAILSIDGIDYPAGRIGSFQADRVDVTDEVNARRVKAGGVTVGTNGVLSFGPVAAPSFEPGEETITLGAQNFMLGSGSAALSVAASGTTPHWLLDSAASETIAALTRIPAHWTTFNVVFWWFNVSGGGAGDVRWSFEYLAVTDGMTITDASSSASVTATALAAQVVESTVVASGLTAPNGLMRLRPMRLGAHAADTLGNDVGLFAVQLVKAS